MVLNKVVLAGVKASVKNKYAAARDRLPDVESSKRWIATKSTASASVNSNDDEPNRTSEGLLVPTEGLFGILVGLYKVYLVIGTMVGILYLVLFGIATVMIAQDEDEKIRDILPFAVPAMAIVALVVWVHLVIGWIGIQGLKLRYLWIDLWLHCLMLVTNIALLFVSVTANSGIALLIQVALVVLVYFVIHEMRSANPGVA